ncbi:NACHT domain-containing protein [Saccharopolyspora taberi]|uniref:NACHT domain-containing protein n=1 Tax=Saccharopolyspora taberi TaxID=60895 RepID=A0ABN3VGN8_9PSEU
MPDPITASLVALLEASFEGLVGNLLTLIGKHGHNRHNRRALTDPESAVRGAEHKLAELRRTELAGMDEGEWNAAAHAVRDSFQAVTPIDLDRVGVLVALDAGRLRDHVAGSSRDIVRAAALSRAGLVAYDRLLALSCEHIVERARHVRELAPLFRRDVLLQLEELAANDRRVIELLTRLVRGSAAELTAGDEFGRRYREQVRRVLGGFELFGVTRGRLPKRQSFTRSYVPLAVARAGLDRENGVELSGAGVGAARALAGSARVLLRGGAGAGKTTFLRWMISRTGESEQDGSLPFFVPLRQFADRDFPAPSEMVAVVAGVLSDEMPSGWAAAQFRQGRALLLVDGIDELVHERRAAAREWLAELVTAYPDVRCFVTTRPAAVGEDWLAEFGFDTYDLLQMSNDGVRRYLASWHEAAREDNADDPETQAWLDECEQKLARAVEEREDLRRLASSPLLCGLLCLLHRDRDADLPRDRHRLFDEALDLLLRRWDEQRGVRRESDRWLGSEEQTVLLQRLAYSFVRNREILIPREQAAQRLGHALHGMRAQVDSDTLLQHLLERTGVLREPSPGHVQFVHRTFRDYLAAHEVVSAGDLGLLLANAHHDEWLDVVVMAVTLARPRERARILQGLLDGNDDARRDPRVADRLRLLAVACLEQASVIEPDEVRDKVRAAAADLIPPDSPQSAELLAEAGTFVLDLLPGPAELSEQDAANVIRTAALIGGPAAVRKIGEFTSVDQTLVIDELLRAWRYAQNPEDYARTVLADVDFGDRQVDMGSWRRIQHVRHLTKLRSIRCRGSVDALEALVAAPRLRHLEFMQNEILRDLGPLRKCETLRSLVLTQCTGLRDLSPLRDTRIEELSLHFGAADLASLQGAPIRKLSIRHRGLDGGLHPLPEDLPLEELVLDSRFDRRVLDGIQRWSGLRRVRLHGEPTEAETRLLRELPQLAQLHVYAPGSAERMAAVREELPGVEVV